MNSQETQDDFVFLRIIQMKLWRKAKPGVASNSNSNGKGGMSG